jgi:hypothetical protein
MDDREEFFLFLLALLWLGPQCGWSSIVSAAIVDPLVERKAS